MRVKRSRPRANPARIKFTFAPDRLCVCNHTFKQHAGRCIAHTMPGGPTIVCHCAHFRPLHASTR